MRYLYVNYQNPIPHGLKYIPQVKVFSKPGQSSRSMSQGTSCYKKKGLFIMHLYLKCQNSSTFGSKDIAQIKVFQNWVKVQGQTSWYQKKGLFIMHLYL
jgi:hypothetical protein